MLDDFNKRLKKQQITVWIMVGAYVIMVVILTFLIIKGLSGFDLREEFLRLIHDIKNA